uniref:Uncharacterized protein n=1 Tax=Amphimedon queenslandica TaxID=400682 RepID=A0A1X7VMX9_AMPQE
MAANGWKLSLIHYLFLDMSGMKRYLYSKGKDNET